METKELKQVKEELGQYQAAVVDIAQQFGLEPNPQIFDLYDVANQIDEAILNLKALAATQADDWEEFLVTDWDCSDNPGAIAASVIDGFGRVAEEDSEQTAGIVCVVYLTKTYEFIIDWHNNLYRNNSLVKEIIEHTQRDLLEDNSEITAQRVLASSISAAGCDEYQKLLDKQLTDIVHSAEQGRRETIMLPAVENSPFRSEIIAELENRGFRVEWKRKFIGCWQDPAHYISW